MVEVAVQAPPVVVGGVWKRFGATDVVADLSFDVRPGEVLGFLGPNGAGKTTTMRMILDIIRPDRGSIEVFGMPPGMEHQGRTGYLPEDRGLYRRRSSARHARLLRCVARPVPWRGKATCKGAADRGGPWRLAYQEGGRAVTRAR